MHVSLDVAFAEAMKLPPDQQELFASFLLAELQDDSEWQRKFLAGSNRLSEMAKEARSEYDSGKTEPNPKP